ncbi:4-hydroxy-tetrahydrodipicolinate synthase [Pseudothermotoga thermarum]|uniref:4-hydroxy-tetrahydrodipicolinate synthase n=1 Tax=Pseudothermotoga thermarum DSM 5069 TaxID=688269 RepID=F7YWR8_9THEM|nr:4-hydroxy-tetrahydrodipicolinate synthase [Pseudothermotoga thermarum]AEH50195.1 dihydrodipicolinate synthase [Pseudothermotoga thermarum DSM 5069]
MFEGVCTAIVTPFKNGEVDYQAYEALVKWQLESGVKAIVVAGTTGEGSTLTEEERSQLTRLTKQLCEGKAKVIVGTGSNDTRKALHLSLLAQKDGADGVLVVTPYYNRPTQEGLYQHYKFLAERLSIPIIIYNVPTRTGVNILPETVVRLARDFPNIVGIKEANPDVNQADEIIKLSRRNGLNLMVWSGNDDRTLHMMAAGAHGVISVVSNVLPRETVEMVEAALKGDLKRAQRLHYQLLDVVKLLFIETNPIPVKAMLYVMGKIENELRLPLVPASEATMEKIRKCVEKMRSEVLV